MNNRPTEVQRHVCRAWIKIISYMNFEGSDYCKAIAKSGIAYFERRAFVRCWWLFPG
jgi:hypothetical protein